MPASTGRSEQVPSGTTHREDAHHQRAAKTPQAQPPPNPRPATVHPVGPARHATQRASLSRQRMHLHRMGRGQKQAQLAIAQLAQRTPRCPALLKR